MAIQIVNAANVNVEILSVVVTGLLVWISALVQNVANARQRGANYVMSDRAIAPSTDGFFGRATRTLSNNVESALMYIPAMLIIIIAGQHSPTTVVVAATYIAARSVFVFSYWFNISGLRSMAWFVGMVCCAMSASVAIGGLF
jgi:uncharacterized MAPEG superfamily protein